MRLTEQEITNAICVSVAQRRMVKPTDVDVSMMWDEDYGFSAEVYVSGRNQILVQATILEAIEQYMYQQYDQRIFRDQIQLVLDEEIVADIQQSY
ncbi:YxcD family protein [Paenibacillus sp. N1-5-1-14]|uniref:YxcD family protein n=1 Tax=Paenibacillus radicibacter TaxID=2972488 RepID=UPI0021591414|nr:YxcD family protein [Paenibacillus radicibacter]MCR8641638.1 YxcD family protein [Paenibacillus radicibacter]